MVVQRCVEVITGEDGHTKFVSIPIHLLGGVLALRNGGAVPLGRFKGTMATTWFVNGNDRE